MAFEAVDLDEKLPSPYLDKYEPAKGKVDYVFICTPKKWRTEIHFSDELKKSFHCFNGSCCKVFPKKTAYTVYLLALYEEGRNAKSSLSLKYIRAGKQLDDAIRSIANQFENPADLTKLDLKFELDTSKAEKYKAIKVTPCVDGKRMAGKEALLELKTQIKTFLPSLQASVADIINEEQFQALCAENGIDISEFTEDEPKPKKKVVEPVEEVEEPEEIGESTEDSTEDSTEEPEDLLVEEVPMVETPAKTKAPVKKKAEDIPQGNFDIDDLLI